MATISQYSDQVRWSPKGDKIAFVNHPFGYHNDDGSDEHIIMIYDLASGDLISLTNTITMFGGTLPSELSFVPDYLNPEETMFSFIIYASQRSTIYLIRKNGTILEMFYGYLPTWAPAYGRLAYVKII